jgi:hypothetical protein
MAIASTYRESELRMVRARNRERLFENAIRAYMNPIEVREIRFAINPMRYEPEVQFLWMEKNGEAKAMRATAPRNIMSDEEILDLAREITERVWSEYEYKLLEDDEDLVDEWVAKNARTAVEMSVADNENFFPWKVWKSPSMEEAYVSGRRFGKSSAMTATATHFNDMYEARMLDLQRLRHELEIEKARADLKPSKYRWDKY